MDLHKFVSKDNEIWLINKTCKNVRNAQKEEDHDAVDGIVDKVKQVKNKLVCFVRKAANNKYFEQIGIELFHLIVDVTGDTMGEELEIKYLIARLTNIILSSLI